MSKHCTHGSIRRRLVSGVLCLALLLGLLPAGLITPAQAHWADSYGQQLVDWGVMRGDIRGNLNLANPITRAEFVTMMNRAYGYTKRGGHPFTDVRSRDWYNDDIDIAYNIGYFKGTGPTTASPMATLTREQAAVLLARNMMMQETVGETLGFSDSRTLSEWSRGLVGAATQNGVLSGYSDGSFQPKRNITRGEVAAMLVRAIGTPIQTPGDHALGNVYGNVTVNTAGVKLRDGVIVGNLYLTGGIDLGEVLLENVTVLGEIIVSGGGESNSSESSIIMRNVKADAMTVDSIGSQFVTIRAEGNTDIPMATVRTNAYVDDSSLPGFGLSRIELDGGSLLQLAGGVKEVWNRTPNSRVEVVQGSADKVTVDEKAVGSSVLVDGDARVDNLNLDVATTVEGTGDIGKLNVGAAGSTVEQLPDKIEIRPGIVADINGETMNSSQAAESSNDPKLLAGYPSVKNIAPASATLVFRTNKSGTVYWAISAVADGSVSEADLLEPPVYGGKILQSGTVSATAANKDFTAAVSGLTKDGSYYVTAMLVDGRGKYSPIKVTSFTTPDDTVPAFAQGYPVMSKTTCDVAQVTVMTNKSCQLYYALLPKGATAPSPAEFKAAAVSGNLGYGTQSVTKNVTTPINVNSVRLDEKTDYVLYLWLTDYDGAKSSNVVAVNFKTPDEQPPIVTDMTQTKETPTAITMSYAIDEPADLVWAIVTEGDHDAHQFLNFQWEESSSNGDKFVLKFTGSNAAADELAAKVRLTSGTGALAYGTDTYKSGTKSFTINNLPTTTSSYVLYYIANDKATDTGNLSTQIKGIRVHTEDNIHPTVEMRFVNPDGTEVTERPQADANIRIIFSENVKGGTAKKENVFLTLYDILVSANKSLNLSVDPDDKTTKEYDDWAKARKNLGEALDTYFKMYTGTPSGQHTVADVRNEKNESATKWDVDWRNAEVSRLDDGTGRVQILLRGKDETDRDGTEHPAALKLVSGSSYYFHLAGIWDLAVIPNDLTPSPCDLMFTTRSAQVQLAEVTERPPQMDNIAATDAQIKENDPRRIDLAFTIKASFNAQDVDSEIGYDILFWSDRNMEITIYSRDLDTEGSGGWRKEGTMLFMGAGTDNGGEARVFRSLNNMYRTADPTYMTPYLKLKENFNREYAIHVDRLEQLGPLSSTKNNWNDTITMGVSVLAGDSRDLDDLSIVGSRYQAEYDAAVPGKGLISIGDPDPFNPDIRFVRSGAPEITQTRLSSVSDTDAEIGFTLNSSGKVNYLIIRLRNVKYTPTGGTLTDHRGASDSVDVSSIISLIAAGGYDTETRVTLDGTTYPAIMGANNTEIIPKIGAKDGALLAEPSWETVKNGYFGESEDIKKGTTPTVMAGRTTYIPGLSGWLKPNSIYFVVAVPEGETVNSCSDEAMCYYFTTQKASRPVLTLSANWATDVEAGVDVSSNVTGKILVQSLVGTVEDGFFMQPFGGTKKTGDDNKVTIENSHIRDDAPAAVKTLYEGNENYTILDALYDPATSEPRNKNGEYPSVFDAYANSDTQIKLINFLTLNNTGNVVRAVDKKDITLRGAQTKNTATLKFTESQLRKSIPYVCIAMAEGTQSNTYGFRATKNLYLNDDRDPTIIATHTLRFGKDAAGADKITGGITILFDQTIYTVGVTGDLKPIAQHPNGAMQGAIGGGKYYGLGNVIRANNENGITIVTASDLSETRSIELTMDKTTTNPNFDVTVQNIYNSAGSPMDTCIIRFTYDDQAKRYNEPTYTWVKK